ncbi:MAG: hypothetical protein IGS48_21330 [Oscillatoriales cyanobacterium C42_A2020_001]|nr:hypothetical protein [Leptolyngbyaceae cyanobacterium C42_A2020_001]
MTLCLRNRVGEILAYDDVGLGEGAGCGGLALGAQALATTARLRAIAHTIQVRLI